jgi:hypothetical protein
VVISSVNALRGVAFALGVIGIGAALALDSIGLGAAAAASRGELSRGGARVSTGGDGGTGGAAAILGASLCRANTSRASRS